LAAIMAINPIHRSLILKNIASVIATDAYVPNEQTSNGEADGIEGEDKIKMTKARSNNRAANGSCNVPACQVSPRRNRKEKAHVFTT